MKRKAMLIGLAVMASMPGWAMAAGANKSASAAHPYSRSAETTAATHAKPESSALQTAWNRAEVAEASPGKMSALRVQMKDVLRSASYGPADKPAADRRGWKLEMLEGNASAYDGGDPRLRQAKPVGVAVRLNF
ncbi:MAG: hypothetical protein HGA75_07045 [Thiobacillus sp.]|nr:hypothetical protein [Thiobacillus sp.]